MFEKKYVHSIVLASGSGARFGGDVPKQFQMLGDMPVFLHSVRKFDKIKFVDGIVLVVPQDDLVHCRNLAIRYGMTKVTSVVAGGKSRQESTYHGLLALDAGVDSIVLVHDAVRPFVDEDETVSLIETANAHDAAILALPVTDTIKSADTTGLAVQTVNREHLYAAKTPQAAHLTDLLAAHEKARQDGFEATDDCQLIENIGIYPKIVITKPTNIKITTGVDLDFAAFLLERGIV